MFTSAPWRTSTSPLTFARSTASRAATKAEPRASRTFRPTDSTEPIPRPICQSPAARAARTAAMTPAAASNRPSTSSPTVLSNPAIGGLSAQASTSNSSNSGTRSPADREDRWSIVTANMRPPFHPDQFRFPNGPNPLFSAQTTRLRAEAEPNMQSGWPPMQRLQQPGSEPDARPRSPPPCAPRV